jgi:nucleoside-diphosphate kinase
MAPSIHLRKDATIMERTLGIVKPDGVSRGLIGEVIKRLESNDFKIVAMKMLHLTKKQAEGYSKVKMPLPATVN